MRSAFPPPGWPSGRAWPPRAASSVSSIPIWKARVVLQKHGLLDAIDAYVTQHQADMPELYQAWNWAGDIERGSNFVATLGPTFNLTSAKIDALFLEASQVVG